MISGGPDSHRSCSRPVTREFSVCTDFWRGIERVTSWRLMATVSCGAANFIKVWLGGPQSTHLMVKNDNITDKETKDKGQRTSPNTVQTHISINLALEEKAAIILFIFYY